MTSEERDRFDALIDEVLRDLPRRVQALFQEAPLIIEDCPSNDVLEEMQLDPDIDTLCGLYTGTPMTDRSVSDPPTSPESIHIFREGILAEAGGWTEDLDEAGQRIGGPDAIKEEIRITILHELGHHFGLEEDDLESLGYQ